MTSWLYCLVLASCLCGNYAALTLEEELELLFEVDPRVRMKRGVSSEKTIHDLLADAESDVNREASEEQAAAKLEVSHPAKDLSFRLMQKFKAATPKAWDIGQTEKILEKITQQIMKLKKLKADTRADMKKMMKFLRSKKPLKDHSPAEPDQEKTTGNVDECPYIKEIKCGQREKSHRTFDGSCNNLKNPWYGMADTPLRRNLDSDYGDDLSAMREGKDKSELPSARLVSSKISLDEVHYAGVSTFMIMTWGQFMDHDVDLTAITKMKDGDKTVNMQCGPDDCDKPEDKPACQPIIIPKGDTDYKNKKCLKFVRSQGVPDIDCTLATRQQLNQITSYIDASNVYGSSLEVHKRLREKKDDGSLDYTMKMNPHPNNAKLKPLLPLNDHSNCNDFTCYLAGDVRVNEQSHLITMHTLWVREHNRIAGQLLKVNPKWDVDTVFDTTRKIVIAMHQHINLKEYFPELMGDLTKKYDLDVSHYPGYDEKIDATSSNVFATASYRYGHSMIPRDIFRYDAAYDKLGYPSLNMSETFFRPQLTYDADNGGIDSFLRGLFRQRSEACDRHFSNQVSSHMFTPDPPHGEGLDLMSANIQRGRDHGLPGYNKWREFCGLPTAEKFSDLKDIFSDKNLWQQYRDIYSHVDDIDLFPAALSEPPTAGALVGPTFACLIGMDLKRYRVGDRFWYENRGRQGFTLGQLQEIRKVTLAKVICYNADNIHMIQPNVFRLHSEDNSMKYCSEIADINFTKFKSKE